MIKRMPDFFALWHACRLGWVQYRTNWVSGDTRLLWLVIMLTLAVLSSVVLLNSRLERVMQHQGASLLGAQAVITGQREIPPFLIRAAHKYHLKTALTLEFPSMLIAQETNALVEVKAVPSAFPLVGHLVIADNKLKRKVNTGPQEGEAWIEPSLMRKLNLKLGDSIQLGDATLKVSAVLHEELSRGGAMFSFAPRVFIASATLPQTHLIQAGSRIKYQLLLSGSNDSVQQLHQSIVSSLPPFYRWEAPDEGRPEIKTIMQKVHLFLGLSASVTMLMSLVAMIYILQPYMQNSVHRMAIYRCLGATVWQLSVIGWAEISLLITSASLVGVLMGALMHTLLFDQFSQLLFSMTVEPIAFIDMLVDMVWLILMAYGGLFVLFFPLIRAFTYVNCSSLMRAQGNIQPYITQTHWVSYLVLLFIISSLFADSVVIAVYFFMGVCLILGLTFVFYHITIRGMARMKNSTFAWPSFNLSMLLSVFIRRKWMVMLQISSLSLFVMGIVLISFIKTNLIQHWQQRLAPETPNQFLINVQQDQVQPIRAQLKQAGVVSEFYPMIRARLIAVNQQPFSSNDFTDERAKRLADREFNLSMTNNLHADNTIVQGRWWTPFSSHRTQISIEEGLAETLHLKLGDQLTFDVSGELVLLQITSLRRVDWGSLHVNFFAVLPEGAISLQNASYISSVYIAPTSSPILETLIRSFPNVTVLNIDAILIQLKMIVERLTTMVEMVFYSTWMAAMLVIVASLIATRELRIQEHRIFTMLGCVRAKLNLLILVEYGVIAAISIFIGYVLAWGVAFLIEAYVLQDALTSSIDAPIGTLAFMVFTILFTVFFIIRPKRILI